MESLIFILVLFVFAWLFLVLPSRRRQRSHAAMQDSVTVGDEIITAGGIHGFVREVDSDEIRLEIADGVVVKVDRRAVAAVARDVPGTEEEEEEGEDGDEGELDEPEALDEPSEPDEPAEPEESLKR
jgi:preprotein translocase subunit YajC